MSRRAVFFQVSTLLIKTRIFEGDEFVVIDKDVARNYKRHSHNIQGVTFKDSLSEINKQGQKWKNITLPFLFLKLHTCLHRNKLLLISNLQNIVLKMLLIAVGVNRHMVPLFLLTWVVVCDIQSERNKVFVSSGIRWILSLCRTIMMSVTAQSW